MCVLGLQKGSNRKSRNRDANKYVAKSELSWTSGDVIRPPSDPLKRWTLQRRRFLSW